MTLAERLRAALALPAPPLLAGDGIDPPPGEPVPAAVLVPFVDWPEPTLILTVRTEAMRAHAGQVAFPGGRIDPDDDGPVAAALREAEEEIGLPSAKVEVIGPADLYRTVTGYLVTPVLGIVPVGLELTPHEHEVAAVFEAPLAHLTAPEHQQIRTLDWKGRPRSFYEIKWRKYRIWGATAAMIVNLSRRLALVR